jgi:hypothetical protein
MLYPSLKHWALQPMSTQENNHRDQGQNHAVSAQDLALPLRVMQKESNKH